MSAKRSMSAAMVDALFVIPEQPADGASSYKLRLSLTTLNALEKRGLVEAKRELGGMWSPWTNISWRLTPAGVVAREQNRPRP